MNNDNARVRALLHFQMPKKTDTKRSRRGCNQELLWFTREKLHCIRSVAFVSAFEHKILKYHNYNCREFQTYTPLFFL